MADSHLPVENRMRQSSAGINQPSASYVMAPKLENNNEGTSQKEADFRTCVAKDRSNGNLAERVYQFGQSAKEADRISFVHCVNHSVCHIFCCARHGGRRGTTQ